MSSTEAPALRVAVLSSHVLTRVGLTQLLSADNSRAAVVEGPVGIERLGDVDVVVVDLLVDLVDHLDPLPHDVASVLAEGVPVVALTSRGKSHLAETALAMGVAEVVHVDTSAEGLLRSVERAAAGHSLTLAAYRRQHSDIARAGFNLTAREVTILELVGAGLLNQAIAERLFLSINTVKTYIRSAYRKIGVTRRAEAVLWAVHHGVGPRSLGAVDDPVRLGVDVEANRVDRRTAVQPGLRHAMPAVHQATV